MKIDFNEEEFKTRLQAANYTDDQIEEIVACLATKQAQYNVFVCTLKKKLLIYKELSYKLDKSLSRIVQAEIEKRYKALQKERNEIK